MEHSLQSLEVVFITEDAQRLLDSQWPHWQSLLHQGLRRILIVCTQPLSQLPRGVEWIHGPWPSPMAKRAAGFLHSRQPIVALFDEDVHVTVAALRALLRHCARLHGPHIVAGVYSNPPDLNNSGRAFNRLCNQWVQNGTHFLGGAFALYQLPKEEGLWRDIPQIGGEEQIFASRCRERGYGYSRCSAFQVAHHSQKSIPQFLIRAFRHGLAAGIQPVRRRTPSGWRALQKSPVREKLWLSLHGVGLLCGAWWAQRRLQPPPFVAGSSPQTSDSVGHMTQSHPSRDLNTSQQ